MKIAFPARFLSEFVVKFIITIAAFRFQPKSERFNDRVPISKL